MLRHPEVRYEVTDNCNAHCIMCPREKHDRPHGIMDQAKYEASIDEIVGLGASQVVLTGFGEPMLDKQLEDKIDYAKKQAAIAEATRIVPLKIPQMLHTEELSVLDTVRQGFAERKNGNGSRGLADG